jgi:hypothetical protein
MRPGGLGGRQRTGRGGGGERGRQGLRAVTRWGFTEWDALVAASNAAPPRLRPAPRHPIFFLHHCNVDRIYGEGEGATLHGCGDVGRCCLHGRDWLHGEEAGAAPAHAPDLPPPTLHPRPLRPLRPCAEAYLQKDMANARVGRGGAGRLAWLGVAWGCAPRLLCVRMCAPCAAAALPTPPIPGPPSLAPPPQNGQGAPWNEFRRSSPTLWTTELRPFRHPANGAWFTPQVMMGPSARQAQEPLCRAAYAPPR